MSASLPRPGVAAALACWALAASGLPPAAAAPVTAARLRPDPEGGDAWLIDGRYLRDGRLIARLRARGELPDVIRAGRCRFGLAGDPGVVYYVRTCR